ncbi:MAG: response regulator transcription factor [Sedimenticola sp.]
MTKQTVIIADDHPVFRVGLSHIINGSEDFAVVAEVENAAELFKVIETSPCDIVILDMKMPNNRDGIQALQRLKENYPEKKVMIMSQMCSAGLVEEAMALGANGYLTKNDISDMILPFLMSINKGEKALSPRIQLMHMTSQGGRGEKLTSRENDILRLSVEGLSRKDIASHLSITISTVNFHRKNIKEKLQTNTLTDMIRIAHERGLVE